MKRFKSYCFQNGSTAQNRIIVPPMASETADQHGNATQKTVDHYARLAQSEAGIVMAEYTYVHLSGKSEGNQLGIDDDQKIIGLAQIAESIQATGALAGIQLTHSGAKSETAFTNDLMGPSAIAVPVKNQEMSIPRAMTANDIQEWKTSFLSAAHRAVKAGFDLVELHAAHGYGLNQWLSPITNQRTDEYGGSIQNRARLLLEIFSSIRHAFPQLILSVRIPGQDLFEGGLTLDESIFIAQELEQRGIDLIHVSSGIGGWRRPKDRSGEGYLVPEAIEIQKNTKAAVIGVGGIQSEEYIENLLTSDQVSFVAIGRAILSDPLAWKENLMQKTWQNYQPSSTSHHGCQPLRLSH